MTDSLSPRRPYLLRAMHEWMLDNHQTPHIVVDATMDGVLVPPEHVQGGRIVLNISATATTELLIAQESVSFVARFGGVSQSIYVPMTAVLGIYAKESGQGMIFTAEQDPEPPTDGSGGVEEQARPQLKVVK